MSVEKSVEERLAELEKKVGYIESGLGLESHSIIISHLHPAVIDYIKQLR